MSKIAFFTEMGFTGKVPRNHKNMRTEFAWMAALHANHINIHRRDFVENYDLGIVILPKNNPNFDLAYIRERCDKLAVMQEGPHWYFQDYPVAQQIEYFNTLVDADIILTHNESDKKYYQGLTDHKDVRVMRTLMIEDEINKIPEVKRDGVIIGGNFVSWYGGFDSYVVASEISEKVYAPSMGRKQDHENHLVENLPYMEWLDWMYKLNEFKIGVHLMRTHAAGTFALNCAYLGIPCIGYKGLDTQELCHPSLTVDIGNIRLAKELIKQLDEDDHFYDICSSQAKVNYKQFHESRFSI